jgi:4-amino-4-deoxy-L-arabinose transferase-like glycosyltransferase
MNRPNRLHWLIFLAIFAFGAFLRWQNMHAIEHNIDHAYPIWQALTTLHSGLWPVTAQGTSVLFANPALTGYLFLPGIALIGSAYGAYLIAIGLNTLAIGFTFAAALRFGSPRQALLAAFLLAASPWVVEYSRTTWVQALLPFFACLIFWLFAALWQGQGRARRALVGFAALAAMTQTYLLAYLAMAPVSIISLVFRRQMKLRWLIIGLLGVAAFSLPYGLGLLADRENTLARVQSFAGGQSQLTAEPWVHTARLISGLDYPASRGLAGAYADALLRQGLTDIGHAALVVAILAGALIAFWRHGRASLILILWLILPPLLMSYVSRPVHPFYLLMTLPAGFILAATTLDWLAAQLGKVGAIAVTISAIGWGVLQGINVLRFAEDTLNTPTIDGFTALPVGAGMAMMGQAVPGGSQAVIFAEADGWILQSLAGRLLITDRDVDQGKTIYYPSQGAIYLALKPAGEMPIDGPERFAFADGARVTIQRLMAPPAWIGEAVLATTDIGLTLLGAQITALADGGHRLGLAWRVDVLPDQREGWLFAPFAHVFDKDGVRVSIIDGGVTPGMAWRLGDLQLKWLNIPPLPANQSPYTIRVGLYDGVRNQAAAFGDGQPSILLQVSLP